MDDVATQIHAHQMNVYDCLGGGDPPRIYATEHIDQGGVVDVSPQGNAAMSDAPPEKALPVCEFPPPGTTLVDADKIVQAIEGMTITAARRVPGCDETILRLEGVELPVINLVITDDGYWTAWVVDEDDH